MARNLYDNSNAVMPAVLQVVGELSRLGGVETVAWELGEAWSRAGIASLFLTCTIVPPVPRLAEVERVVPWISRVSRRGAMRYLGRLFTVPIFTIAATRALARHPEAVVVSHGDTLRGDILVVHALNKVSLQEKRRERKRGWMLNPIHLWTAWRDAKIFTSHRYRRFVAVSRRVKDDLVESYGVDPARIVVIPNGIDLGRFRFDAAARARVRRAWGIPADARVALFAGHEFDRKGLAQAITAIAQTKAPVWLLVVGSDAPARYERLARQLGVNVVFAGTQSDMPSYYSAADAFLLPTAYETFSLVCMEALACSLPVFATQVGGVEDYLRSGYNGHIIPRDPDGIAEIISPYFENPVRLDALRQGARDTAAGFGWDFVGRTYLDLIGTVAQEKSGLANAPPAIAQAAR